MAGIGKYTKGAKFTLKSGNRPAFKMMAEKSPITSPYMQKKEGEGKGKKIAKGVGNALVAGLTSGLDAVYGTGKIMPSGSARLITKKKDEKKIELGAANVNRLLASDNTPKVEKTEKKA